MIAEIKAAAKDGDSLGGVVEVLGFGVPSGSAATCTGTASSTPDARPGGHEHPGGEGRGDR
jgi:hypothetical protein